MARATAILDRLPAESIPLLRAKLQGFEEPPVGMRTFLSDARFLGGTRVWPSVREDLIALFDREAGEAPYREAVFCEGIGSGKSFKSSIAIAYLVYRLACLRNPQAFYRLANGSRIVVLNMSPTGPQARRVVFGDVKQRIDECPWFAEHGMLPEPSVKSELRFPKGITVFPGNSSSTFPLGYNVFAGVLDEAAFYTDTDESDRAQDIHDAILRRIRSRFGQDGLLITISSPRYVDDFVETLMQRASVDEGIFARRRATWESRPSRSETFRYAAHPVSGETVRIPMDLADAFDVNPEKAWRDFGAVPSLVLEPYLRDREAIVRAFRGLNRDVRAPWQPQEALYAVHVDLGRTRDACGVAVGHRAGEGVVIDAVAQFVPESHVARFPDGVACGEREVDFDRIRQVILGLASAGFPIASVSYDGWQSADSIQLLAKQGVVAVEQSTDRTMGPYDTMKELLYGDRLTLPAHASLQRELERLELVAGKKVDHPPKGSKDLADAVAGVCWALQHGEVATEVSMTELVDDQDMGMPSEDVVIGGDY
jgi:hypothetical protein